VYDLGFRVWGLGCKMQGSGFLRVPVQDLTIGILGYGLQGTGSGYRIRVKGFRVRS